MADFVWVENDCYLEIDGLMDAASQTYLNANCNVTANLKTEADALVAGPLTMSYVGGSSGKYRTLLQNTLPIQDGATYYAYIEVDSSGLNIQGKWRKTLIGKLRTA